MPSTILGFTIPTLGELIDRILDDLNANLAGEDARIPESEPYALGVVLAGAIKGVYGFCRNIAEQLLPDRATGAYLDRWAGIWGVTRIAAVKASGTITITGTNGYVAPTGTVWELYDGSVRWVSTAPATIAAGTATVSVEAELPGADGNATVGTLAVLADELAGIDFEGTVVSIAGGTDLESDEALRGRLLDRIRDTPQGGAEDDYEAWTKLVGGVARVWVTPNETGWGTVGVRFINEVASGGASVDAIPSGADIAAAQALIDYYRPVTADVTVYTLTEEIAVTGHTFQIAVTPDTAPVRTAVEAELNALCLRRAEPGGTLHLSEIIGAIDAATGEEYHDLQLIDGAPPADISIGTNGWPTIGTITWV